MLIITGTQRSGTSAAALMFQAEGYDLGSNLWDDIAQGGLENEVVCAFYRYYLGDSAFPFDDFPGLDKVEPLDLSGPISPYLLPEDEFSILDRPVIKFSYLCMNPAFVTIWSKFRPPSMGDRFLIMKRNFDTVIASKRAHTDRFMHDSRLLTQEPETLKGNFMNSVVTLIDLGYPTVVMSFHDLMYTYSINDYLIKLGCNLRIKEETWKGVIDISKVHF